MDFKELQDASKVRLILRHNKRLELYILKIEKTINSSMTDTWKLITIMNLVKKAKEII